MTKLTNSYNFERSLSAKITKMRENFENHNKNLYKVNELLCEIQFINLRYWLVLGFNPSSIHVRIQDRIHHNIHGHIPSHDNELLGLLRIQHQQISCQSSDHSQDHNHREHIRCRMEDMQHQFLPNRDLTRSQQTSCPSNVRTHTHRRDHRIHHIHIQDHIHHIHHNNKVLLRIRSQQTSCLSNDHIHIQDHIHHIQDHIHHIHHNIHPNKVLLWLRTQARQ